MQWFCKAWDYVRMNFGGWIKGSVVLAVIGTCFVLGARAGWYGTSSLSVTPFVPGKTASGVVYFLPRTVIDVEAVYQITKCDVEYKKDRYPISIEASVSSQFNEINEPDFARGYTIETRSFAGGIWNTDFTAEVSKGLLKSVNAESTSNFAPPKEFDINSLVKIAIEGSGSGKQSAAEPSAEEIQKNVEEIRKTVCGSALIEALTNAKETKPDPKDDKPKFSATTMRRVFRVVPGAGCPSGTDPANPPTAGVLICIFKGEDSVGKLIADTTNVTTALKKYTIEIRINEAGRVSATAPDHAAKGLVYRIPGSAFVTICLCSGAASATRVLAERTIAVSQFGPEAVIEVERRMFSDRKAQLDFGGAGELTKARFSDTKTEPVK